MKKGFHTTFCKQKTKKQTNKQTKNILKTRRLVHRVTTNDNLWYNDCQRIATTKNELQRSVNRMTTSGTMSANK